MYLMTKQEILDLPLNKLPEACAVIVGLKHYEVDNSFYADFGYASEPYFEQFRPHASLDDARYVANFVVSTMSERTEVDAEKIRFRIYQALQVMMDLNAEDGRSWNLLFHTPAQLSRACLLVWNKPGEK